MLGHTHRFGFLTIVLLLALLMGCRSAPPTPTEAPRPTSSSPPSVQRPAATQTLWSPPPTFTPRPTFTSRPVLTATVTPTPLPTAFDCTFDPQTPIFPGEPISQAVLFVVPMYGSPRLWRGEPQPALAADGGLSDLDLWAVSLDGQRLGQVTQDQQGIAVYIAPEPPHAWQVFSATPLVLESDLVGRVPLPSECQSPDQAESGSPWLPCREFRFSPDEHWIAFRWGPDRCGSGLALMSLSTGSTLPLGDDWLEGGVHWFHVTADGKLVVADGPCQGGEVYLFDPSTQARRQLGPEGEVVWNLDRSAFGVNVSQLAGWPRAVWGYDLATEQVFGLEEEGINEQAIWTPDGTQLLYQHRPLTATGSLTFTIGPREIRIVDAASGQTRTLVGDPEYDYHLCTFGGSCAWSGEWIAVRRIPFHPLELPDPEQADWDSPEIDCVLTGIKCVDLVETLALNWRTGEVSTWDQAPRPTAVPATPPLTPPPEPISAPALDLDPLYVDSAGEYALYPGEDGHSLWCLPQQGEPVRWISNGWHFVLIP